MMLPTLLLCAAVILAASGGIVHGFAPSGFTPSSVSVSVGSRSRRHPLPALRNDDRDHHRRGCGDPSTSAADAVVGRDRFLVAAASVVATTLPLSILTSFAAPSNALVKGNAPPPKKRPADDGEQGGQPKCRNVEECQEMAEREEALRAQREAALAASGPKPRIAPGGTKYLDVVDGAGSPPPTGAAAAVAKVGDAVDVHYKVLKIGKRSFDGLSGEGTVVFSRGYALEDDERVPGDRSFRFTIGDDRVIKGESAPSTLVGYRCRMRGARVFSPADDGKFSALANVSTIDVRSSDPRSLERRGPGDGRGGHAPDKRHPPERLGEEHAPV